MANTKITSGVIADDAVLTANITDANVTTAKIAADAVTSAKVADDAINSEHLAADSIDAEHYAAGSVDATAIASNAVTTAKINDDAVTTAKIADAQITTALMADDSVTSAKLDTNIAIAGTLDSSGRLLIGTDSGDAFNADSMLRLQRAGDRVFQQFKTDADQNSGILFGDVDDDVECAIEYEPANKALTFSTNNNTETMRLDSSGNVGISTSSPQKTLDVKGTFAISNTTNSYWDFDRDDSDGALKISDTGTERIRIYPSGYMKIKDSGNDHYGLVLEADNNDAWVRMGHDGTDGRIHTTYNSSAGATPLKLGVHGHQEAITIATNGLVTVAQKLQATSGIYISAFDGDKLITDGSQGGGTDPLFIGNAQIQVSSDERIKKDIVDTAINATEKLKQVRVVDFTWNDPKDQSYNNKNARGQWTGAIAQELISVFPHIINAPRDKETLEVDNDSDRKWMVEYENLVPVLIKAIQELEARIKTLEDA